ncbi:MAG: putative DNA binding domain-containing protein [Eubacterium sp.]|nr:putative DNA binding domain-containing protein [Eubacterium sp.]
MSLEIGIESLLNKEKIESNRIEFKKGWNPDDIYRSICAFANDYDSQGGGYILIGVEEKDGVAIRPVFGVEENMLDRIQKEMIGYNKLIMPSYSPKVSIEDVDDKKIIAIWIPTGSERPYKVPDKVTTPKGQILKLRIRSNSNSVVATPEQERELYAMASNEPYDMVGNPNATLDDISEVLLTEHLKATGSKLVKQIRSRGLEEVLDEMQLLSGPPERHRIRNVALMMFCEEPDKFFPYMQVDIVKFPEGSIKNPNSFIEVPSIKGTVPQIIKRTMEKIQDLAIESIIDKVNGQMESVTSTSYPYNAIEEAVVNAFYHRDYKKHEPVTIEIEPDCIRIINCPGIDRSVPDSAIKEGKRFRSRYYRNRRLGEFLHELELCEGHCTGIPTIQEELEINGSPEAVFETDPDRQSVCVTIPIHPRFLEKKDSDQSVSDETNIGDSIGENIGDSIGEKSVNNQTIAAIRLNKNQNRIVELLRQNSFLTGAELAEEIGISKRNIEENIKKLKEMGVLVRNGSAKKGYWEIMDKQ